MQLHEDVGPAVEACRLLKAARDVDPRIESVLLFAPTGEAVWDVFEGDEPADLMPPEEEELGGPIHSVPYNRLPVSIDFRDWSAQQVGAVRALLAVEPTHGFLIGALQDGVVPLWLHGGGEYADHRWMIAKDGTPYPEGTQFEAEADPVAEPTPVASGPQRRCPDGGACHHDCGEETCWRAFFAEPLSGVYPNDTWPSDLLDAMEEPEHGIEGLIVGGSQEPR